MGGGVLFYTKKHEELGQRKKSSLGVVPVHLVSSTWDTGVERFCSGLEKSPFGAKSDFEIWAFKVFFCFWDQKKAPRKAWRWPHLKI